MMHAAPAEVESLVDISKTDTKDRGEDGEMGTATEAVGMARPKQDQNQLSESQFTTYPLSMTRAATSSIERID